MKRNLKFKSRVAQSPKGLFLVEIIISKMCYLFRLDDGDDGDSDVEVDDSESDINGGED